MSSFSDLRQKKRRRFSCPRCGEAPAGAVYVALREGSGTNPKHITSRSFGFCEPCAVDGYRLVERVVERYMAKKPEES